MNNNDQSKSQLIKQLEERLRFEQLIANLSAQFVNIKAEDVDGQIESGLKKIVEFFGVDRSTLFQFSEDGTGVTSSHSYAVSGVKPADGIRVDIEFPWSTDKWSRGEVMYFSSIDDLPPEAESDLESFHKLDIKSTLTIPLSEGGTIGYVISIGTARNERSWPTDIMPRLRVLGEVFVNSLARKKSEERIHSLMQQLKTDNIYLSEEMERSCEFGEMVGQSEGMEYVCHRIKQVAPTSTPVLILGETGTGKELVARAVHRTSDRNDRPLVKVNCSNLPATLIERELFGHERGAFSGAHQQQIGRFEYADGATLFLDEIGELPLELQPKLLRVLQDGEFERLGNPRTRRTDVRIIAATNKDLDKEIRDGSFRRDLFYRLNVFPISIPPLRERLDDIPLLVRALAQKIGLRLGKKFKSIPKRMMIALQDYDWPGNVRELENLIERAMIVSSDSELRVEQPGQIIPKDGQDNTLKVAERVHILRILEKTNWKIKGDNGAAEVLGLKPSTLRDRMKKLGIERSNR